MMKVERSLFRKRPRTGNNSDDDTDRHVTAKPPSASGSAPIAGAVVAFTCAGTHHDEPVFRLSGLGFDKLLLAVPQPDDSCNLVAVLDYHDRARPLLRQQLHANGPDDDAWTAFVGAPFTLTLLGGGAGAAHQYNNAVHTTYSMRDNSRIARAVNMPLQLPRIFLTRHDVMVRPGDSIFTRNFFVCLDLARAQLSDQEVDTHIAAEDTVTMPAVAYNFDEHGHITDGFKTMLEYHCKGRHPAYNRLVFDHLRNPGVAMHARMLALINAAYLHNPNMREPLLRATHEAAALAAHPTSPAIPPLLLALDVDEETTIMPAPGLNLPQEEQDATWAHAEVLPRDIATACCVCHTKVGPGNPNRVCADATCPAAAAGDETVDTYVFADVLSVRAGDLFDGIYAAIPMPIAQELFHALPPYPNADVMKQQSVECCVTLHRGTVAATALVNHDVA